MHNYTQCRLNQILFGVLYGIPVVSFLIGAERIWMCSGKSPSICHTGPGFLLYMFQLDTCCRHCEKQILSHNSFTEKC